MGVVAVDEAFRKGAPRLEVDGREVDELGAARREFVVASVPFGRQRAGQALSGLRSTQHPVLAMRARVFERPHFRRALAVDQHHGRVPRREREESVGAHVQVEELPRIREVDLVDVVVDGSAL